MSSPLPPNFVDLNTVSSCMNREVNVMGVVTDFLPPAPSRGTDWMCSFSITDPTYNGIYNEGLKIRFFKPLESELPAIRGTGDIVLMRSLKINDYRGMTCGLSSRATSWTVFPAASIPTNSPASTFQLEHIKEPRAPDPIFQEMQYAVTLCNSLDRIAFTGPSPVVPVSGNTCVNRAWRDKFALIKDVACDTFYDLVGQVARVYPHNDRVEVYLTDYTSNNLLFNYEWGQDNDEGSGREGDTYNYVPRDTQNKKWPGPFGKMTLTVTLWPPHAQFGRQNLKDNDFVHFRNVRLKFSKDLKLEGVLHSDRRYPDRVDVTILKHNENDDRVKDVLRRKRDYAKKFEKSTSDFVNEARGLKRKEMEEAKPLSKPAQRKKRKQERERLANRKLQTGTNEVEKENNAQSVGKGQLPGSPSLHKTQRQDLNLNVKCANHLVPIRSLSSILSLDKHHITTPEGYSYILPFQNINSRAAVRVVDFFPNELADFAVPCPKSSEFDILSEPGDSQSESEIEIQSGDVESSPEQDRRWEWRFCLTLEDASGPKSGEKARMEVYVAGQDAECLLKLDAANLRQSSSALPILREKLFLLWGDLEERKTQDSTALKQVNGNPRLPAKEEAPKCKPFQCCLKEYGVKAIIRRSIEQDEREDENANAEERADWTWERRWRLFGTTIV